MPEPAAPKKQKAKRLLTFENCTSEQRKSINLWTAILQDWQGQREQYQKKTEFDHLYVAKCQLEHPELQISTDILYRKWSAYKENDFAGLLRQIVCLVPIFWAFSFLGLQYTWLSFPISECISGGIGLLFYGYVLQQWKRNTT